MPEDIIAAARAEEQRLLESLRRVAQFNRLEAVRALLAAYGEPTTGAVQAPRRSSGIVPRHASPRAGSLTSQVVAAAEEYLRQQQRRAQSLEILRALNARGIEVQGEKPTTVVASILSHSTLFDNVRGEGYGLSEWGDSSAAVSSSDPTGGGDPDAEHTESTNCQTQRRLGLDSRADLVSNRDWATNA